MFYLPINDYVITIGANYKCIKYQTSVFERFVYVTYKEGLCTRGKKER